MGLSHPLLLKILVKRKILCAAKRVLLIHLNAGNLMSKKMCFNEIFLVRSGMCIIGH